MQPALAFEADGDAFAVVARDGVIRARRYDAAAGAWESASAALSSDTGGADLPAVQVDADGVATVAWQSGGTIEAKRYDAGQASAGPPWRRACRPRARPRRACGSASTRPASSQAVWSASDASGTFVQSRRFDGGWGAPALLSPKIGTDYAPRLAVAPNGAATVVWYAQSDGKFVVRARRWTGDRWDPAATLSNPSTNAWSPAVAVDKAGRATVVWRRRAPRRRSRPADSTAPGAPARPSCPASPMPKRLRSPSARAATRWPYGNARPAARDACRPAASSPRRWARRRARPAVSPLLQRAAAPRSVTRRPSARRCAARVARASVPDAPGSRGCAWAADRHAALRPGGLRVTSSAARRAAGAPRPARSELPAVQRRRRSG